MTDELSLPPLQVAVLDNEAVTTLLEDVASLGSAVEVTLRIRSATGGASYSALPLAATAESLGAPDTLGVSLRYRHEGKDWLDTLLPGPDGVRLVRIEAPPRG